MFVFNEIFGRGSLKDYLSHKHCQGRGGLRIYKWSVGSRSLLIVFEYTLELNKNTMLIYCI
jgi:hypothetical protein